MSCDSNLHRVIKMVKTGISRLSGKRGFYAGVAVSAAGLSGAGLVLAARRLSNPRQNDPFTSSSGIILMRDIPKIQTQAKIKPATKISGAERCAICRTPAGSKPGAWYNIGNQIYCPDCAGSGANRGGVVLVTPEPALPTTSAVGEAGVVVNGSRGSGGKTAGGVPVAAGQLPSTDILPAEKMVQTRLVHSKVGIRLGDTPQGQPIPYITQNGEVVVRRDNGDATGLALVPTLIDTKRPETPISEDLSEWWIIHVPSGRNVSHRGYKDKKSAWQLASVLAQIDWNRDELEIPDTLIGRANNTITFFDYHLDKKSGQGGSGTAQVGGAGSNVPTDQSLEGRILTTAAHGILRVMKDEGSTLFVIDSTGTRYVIDRTDATIPTPADFETLRVAVPLEPSKLGEQSCSDCGAKAKEVKGETRWYMMGWKPYCSSCGPRFANAEDYELPENIGAA